MAAKIRRYLITAAALGAEPHYGFIACLEAYAKRIGAEIIVCPVPGKRRDEMLHSHLMRFKIATTDLDLCANLDLRCFRLRASQIDPLTGLSRFIQFGKSAVIPSPKQFFRAAACIVGLPKVMYTTGACTDADYSESRVGDIGCEDHVLGAVVVEVDGTNFHARHIRWKSSNSFTDLGQVVRISNGQVLFSTVRANALIPGDWHTGDTDLGAREGIFRMVEEYQPRKVVLHDIFNGHSISHHEAGKGVTMALAAKNGRLGLNEELKEVAEELGEIESKVPDDCEVVIAKSNHDEWLMRYLEEGRFMDDPINYRASLDLAAAAYDGDDPLEVGVRNWRPLKKTRFLKRDESLKVGDWELAQHGDLGVNGSGAGIRAIEAAAGHAVVGHRHTPEVFRGLIIVGTTTKLRLPYNKGPSTWLNAAALIWPDGSGQLLVQVGGKGSWRF